MEHRDTLQIAQIHQVIRKRLWLIVLCTLLTSGLVFAVSTNMAPIYEGKVTMTVDQSSDVPFSYRSILTGEELALTYSKLLKTRPILEIVIANLSLDLSPEQLKEMLGTNLIPETQLLELTVQDTNPQRASDIANEIAFTFISLHNSEQGLQNLASLEQDVVEQLVNLKELIARNPLALDQSRASSGLLNEEEPNLAAVLSAQHSAYAGLLATYLNIQLTQAQFFDVNVAEPAIPPTQPIRPNIPLYTFLGAFVGLNIGVGLAFLLEHLKTTFETSDDVRRILSLPTLGTIPRLRREERNARLATVAFPRYPASEAYRALRTNTRFFSIDEPLKTLLITSAEPQAGKTTVAANLGVAFAQDGLQVVLIDADLRFPTLHQLFDLGNQHGLADLLLGDIQNADDCMKATEVDNLRLITSGPIPPNPSELLGSKRMEAVLAQVQKRADLVILDTSPTLVVTDAAVLAQKADGVLLVVSADTTRRETARHALDNLLQVGANPLGVVLNAASTPTGSYFYSYYKRYGAVGGRRLDYMHRTKRYLEAAQRLFKKRRHELPF